MDKTTLSSTSSTNAFIQWSGLGAVVGPVLFVVMFTLAGILRPNYLPLSQAISDLGVGPMAWLLNIPLVILGGLLVAFAIGFYLSPAIQSVISPGWRLACAMFLAGPGMGYAVAGIFDETKPLHWLAGQPLLGIGSVGGFLITGLLLVRNRHWRTYGVYSLLSSGATVALIVWMNVALNPSSPPALTQFGGLAERVAFFEILAWYVAMGWQIFITADRPGAKTLET